MKKKAQPCNLEGSPKKKKDIFSNFYPDASYYFRAPAREGPIDKLRRIFS